MLQKLFSRRSSEVSEPKQVYEVYESCSELPLYNWIKLNVTGDHNWLLKSGVCDDLSGVYEKIREEYSQLTNDAESTYLFNLQKELEATDNRLKLAKIIIDKLSERRIEPLIDILKKKFNMPFKYEDLKGDLNKTTSRFKTDYLRLKKKEADYLKYFEKNDQKKPEEKQWHEQLAILSKWIGFQVNAHNTTLMQYIVYLNQFKKEIKLKVNSHGR